MSVKLFRRMQQHKLVRHYAMDCTYRLSPRRRAILRPLWEEASDDNVAPDTLLAEDDTPFIVDGLDQRTRTVTRRQIHWKPVLGLHSLVWDEA